MTTVGPTVIPTEKAPIRYVSFGPIKAKVGGWHTKTNPETRAWLDSRLKKDPIAKIAQRAGILPVKIVTVKEPGGKKKSYALFIERGNAFDGTGSYRYGIFDLKYTPLIRQKERTYKITNMTSSEWKKFWTKVTTTPGAASFSHSPFRTIFYKFGPADKKQMIEAYHEGGYLVFKRRPSTGYWKAFSFFTGVWTYELMLKSANYLIDVFGEVIGTVLDVAGGIVGGFQPGIPDSGYAKKPNYLLWGGVALGIVAIAVVVKKRGE